MVPKNKDELLSEIHKNFYKFLNLAKKIDLENIHQKIAFSSPQALLDTMWRSERD